KRSDQDTEGQHVATSDAKHIVHFSCNRACHLIRPGLEDKVDRRLGEAVGAKEACKRGCEDKERKERHNGADCQMTGHSPAVVIVEMAERIANNTSDGIENATTLLVFFHAHQ